MKSLALLALVSSTAMAGSYVRVVWDKHEISVCFAKGESGPRVLRGATFNMADWSRANKQKMQAWILEEYSAERTGIHFSGWTDCAQSPAADVVLFYNKNSALLTAFTGGIHGMANNLGSGYPNSIDGYPEAMSAVVISKSGMKKGTVVHEFGHVAGLGHEHNHPDVFAGGETCSDASPKYSARLDYEAFDINSIMNYCALHRGATELSPADVALIKRLYP